MAWPFLLLGYCVTALYNLKAGLAFIVCLVCVRIIKHAEIDLEQLAFFATYTCMGVMVFLFFDRMSGVAFAACGIVYGLHLFGVIDHRPKAIAAEVILVLGMVASVFGGPSGGYWADSGRPVRFGSPNIGHQCPRNF
tara:strand:- start:1663 stop:2073 length:411 start_codon:yes stop_codon:yes gene_type:complete